MNCEEDHSPGRVLAVPGMTQGVHFADQRQGGGWNGSSGQTTGNHQGGGWNGSGGQNKSARPSGIRPRTPRRDAKGNIIMRYLDKEQTEWENFDAKVQARPSWQGVDSQRPIGQRRPKSPVEYAAKEERLTMTGATASTFGHALMRVESTWVRPAAEKAAALFFSGTFMVRDLLTSSPSSAGCLLAVMRAADIEGDEPEQGAWSREEPPQAFGSLPDGAVQFAVCLAKLQHLGFR